MAIIDNIINALGSIIGYLNSNSGLIAAIATVVLVGITWRYVRLTQETLENTYRPEVVVRLLKTGRGFSFEVGSETRQSPILFLMAKNIGPGVARKVEFEGHRSFNPDPENMGEFPLTRVFFLEKKTDCLLIGEELKSDDNLLGYPLDMTPSDLNKFKVTITVTWEDLKGKKYYDDFPLNFADRNLPYE